MKRKVLFISSTGGHLDELLQLAPLFEKYEYNITLLHCIIHTSPAECRCMQVD